MQTGVGRSGALILPQVTRSVITILSGTDNSVYLENQFHIRCVPNSVGSTLTTPIDIPRNLRKLHRYTLSSVYVLHMMDRYCDCICWYNKLFLCPILENVGIVHSSIFRHLRKEIQNSDIYSRRYQQRRFLSTDDKNKINREIDVVREKYSADVAASQASEANIYTLTEFVEMEEKEYRAGKTITETVDSTLDNPMFLLWGVAVLGAVVFAVVVGIRIRREQQRFDPRLKAVKVLNNDNVDIGGPFSLYDTDGNVVTNEDLKGKWMFIYFGFVNCPDICPAEMQKMAKVTRELDKRVGKDYWQPIFISIDPKRDTKEILKEYLREFNPRILGLSAESKVVEDVARKYRVYYAVPDEDGMTDDDYLIDHSIVMYLMDPEGKFVDYTTKEFMWNEIYTKLLRRMMDYETNKARCLNEKSDVKSDGNTPNDGTKSGNYVNKVNVRVANISNFTPIEDDDKTRKVSNQPPIPTDLRRIR